MSDTQQPGLPADQDIKDNSNLLNSSDTVQDLVDKAQIVTEVSSVAKEASKLGEALPKLSPEEILARAVASYHRNITMLSNLVKARSGSSYVIGRKGMNRVLSAIMQMPTEGLPVGLQGEEEKLAFHLGQKVLMDRYIITHHHIVEEQKRIKEQESASQAAQTSVESNKEGESNDQKV